MDQRRLRDGARALEIARVTPRTVEEARRQLDVFFEAIAALQSLDDLGEVANARAAADIQILWERSKTIQKYLRDNGHT